MMSARAPAGSASRKTGSMEAAWTRLTISGEGARLVISQPAPVFCIQMPILLASVASQSVRKTGGEGAGRRAASAIGEACQRDRHARPGCGSETPAIGLARASPAPATSTGMAERFASFAAFWPHYLREHARPATRSVHVGGTWAAAALLVAAVLPAPGGWRCSRRRRLWLRLGVASADRAQPPGDLHLPGLVAARRPAAGLAGGDRPARRGAAAARAVSRRKSRRTAP